MSGVQPTLRSVWLTVSSGLGREGSHGIEEYMNTKLIVFGGLA